MEREISERYGFGFASVSARKLPGGNPVGLAVFAVSTIAALIEAAAKLMRIRPSVVVGFGGYVTFPSVVSAAMLGIPIYLQEQNVIPGKVNRRLSRRARGMFTSFDATERLVGCPAVKTGNPTRFEGKPRPDREACRKNLGLDQSRTTILIFGGSQGAASINKATVDFAKIEKDNPRLQILHITGRKNYDGVLKDYKNGLQAGQNKTALIVKILPYLEEMDVGYCAADIVVCRAGATAIAELMEFGKPAILVPYPHAAESHQAENADFLADREAAIVIDDESLTGLKMAEEVGRLISNPRRLDAMAEMAGSFAVGNAASRIVDEIAVFGG